MLTPTQGWRPAADEWPKLFPLARLRMLSRRSFPPSQHHSLFPPLALLIHYKHAVNSPNLFFFVWLHLETCWSCDRGSNLRPLHWKHRISIAGPPTKSQFSQFQEGFSTPILPPATASLQSFTNGLSVLVSITPLLPFAPRPRQGCYNQIHQWPPRGCELWPLLSPQTFHLRSLFCYFLIKLFVISRSVQSYSLRPHGL